jgi:hypothetical protein
VVVMPAGGGAVLDMSLANGLAGSLVEVVVLPEAAAVCVGRRRRGRRLLTTNQ